MDAPPPDLSQGDKDIVFYQLDLNLNHLILQALFHGEALPYPCHISLKLPLQVFTPEL